MSFIELLTNVLLSFKTVNSCLGEFLTVNSHIGDGCDLAST